MRRHGSRLTAPELAAHRTPSPPPVEVAVNGTRVIVQPPVSQGILAAAALARSNGSGGVDLVDAMVDAFAMRHVVTTDQWADVLGTLIPMQTRFRGPTSGTHTTSVACADDAGMTVAVLISVYHEFGCGVFVEEIGSFLNDRLLGANLAPLSADRRPLHTLAPMLLVRDGLVTALATPGADAQVQVLAQVAQAVMAEGCSLPEAIERPRWRLQDGRLLVEEGTPHDTIARLRARDHDVAVVADDGLVFGSVTAAGHDGRSTFAVADSRRSCDARSR